MIQFRHMIWGHKMSGICCFHGCPFLVFYFSLLLFFGHTKCKYIDLTLCPSLAFFFFFWFSPILYESKIKREKVDGAVITCKWFSSAFGCDCPVWVVFFFQQWQWESNLESIIIFNNSNYQADSRRLFCMDCLVTIKMFSDVDMWSLKNIELIEY